MGMGHAAVSRRRYTPDGGMPVGSWGLLAGGSFLAAMAGGWLLWRLFVVDWYLVGLVPAVFGLILGLAVGGLVRLGHCRKPGVAAALGGAAGLIMFLGYYYFSLVSQLPPGNAHRLDLLPRYVLARLEGDVQREVKPDLPGLGPPVLKEPAPQPSFGLNVLWFALEAGVIVVIATGAPWLASQRPYAAEIGRWMSREAKRVPPGLRLRFCSSLEGGTLGEFVGWLRKESDSSARTANDGFCAIEYVRDAYTCPLDYPVYVIFVDQGTNLAQVVQWREKFQLEVPEVLDLRPLFPRLDRILSAFDEQRPA